MKAEELVRNVNETFNSLTKFSESYVSVMELSDSPSQFLRDVGLPKSAAPFVSFDEYEEQELPQDYVYIGSTASGDWICIKKQIGDIYIIDHEEMSYTLFMNSSVMQLAECLLIYKALVKKAQEANGKRAMLERNIPADLIEKSKNDLLACDERSLDKGSFWWETMDVLVTP